MAKEKKKKKRDRGDGGFHTGDEGRAWAEKWNSEHGSSGRGMSRLKVNNKSKEPKKREALVIFMDDVCIFFPEHAGKVPGKKNRYFNKRCVGEDRVCGYCQEEIKVRMVFVPGTVINCTGFRNDDGERIRYFRQVVVFNSKDAATEFQLQRDKLVKEYGSEAPLKYTMWRFRRDQGKTAPATGTHFEFVRRFENKKAIKRYLEKKGVERDDWKAFLSSPDYAELFPKESDKQIKAFLGLGKRVNDDDDDDGYDDDVADDDDVENEAW